jgi:hypothetical protein
LRIHEPDLSLMIKELVGRHCIGFTAGESTGSVVDVEFEPRRPRRRPLANQNLTEEQRTGDPEYSILVECLWRLDAEMYVVCGSWDDNASGGTSPARRETC